MWSHDMTWAYRRVLTTETHTKASKVKDPPQAQNAVQSDVLQACRSAAFAEEKKVLAYILNMGGVMYEPGCMCYVL